MTARSDLTVLAALQVSAMSDQAVAQVRALETLALQLPQIEIETQHTLHAGMYARTVKVPKDMMITGALVRIPTVLIVAGDCLMYTEDGTISLRGYHVFQAAAHRKQAFVAREDTWITMMFPTAAQTVAEAEEEFTAEADLLVSRREGAVNSHSAEV